MPVGDERVVDVLNVVGVQPDCGTDAGPRSGGKIGAGNDVAQRECDRLGLEDDRVRGPDRRADEAEVLLVEGLGGVEVARLQ